MLLDKFLLNELENISSKIVNLNSDIDLNVLINFWIQVRDSINNYRVEEEIDKKNMPAIILGNLLFCFVTNTDIRNRKVTSRIFEDIFSGLFNSEATDEKYRENPNVTPDVESLFRNNKDSKELLALISSNKREKTDVIIKNHNIKDLKISLKTLKGKVYNQMGEVIDSDFNNELNIGSFSFEVLCSGILDDNKIKTLSERKSGLGSMRQLRKNVFNEIKTNNKKDVFSRRLKVLLNYVYGDDDFCIIFKSHYKMIMFFIPGTSFVNAIVDKYEKEEDSIEHIIYRWEGNNLRIKFDKLIKYMDKENEKNKDTFPYQRIDINLANAVENKHFIAFLNNTGNYIKKNINEILDTH